MVKKRLRILLVDNDEQCLQAYRIALEPGNFICATEKDPEVAFEYYKEVFETQHKFDVILTDFLMPGISGLELLRRIKEFDPCAKVIIITAFTDSLVLKADSLEKAYAVFPKPLHLPSLISVLQKIDEE